MPILELLRPDDSLRIPGMRRLHLSVIKAVNVPKERMLRIPKVEPKSMTKMAETRRPIRPSKSLSERHAGVVSTVVAAADADADGSASRRTTLAMAALSVPGDMMQQARAQLW